MVWGRLGDFEGRFCEAGGSSSVLLITAFEAYIGSENLSPQPHTRLGQVEKTSSPGQTTPA